MAAQRVLAQSTSRTPFARTVATCILGVTSYWSAQLTEAAVELTEARQLARADGNNLAAAYAEDTSPLCRPIAASFPKPNGSLVRRSTRAMHRASASILRCCWTPGGGAVQE
jgi:hypothetical protein